MKIITKYLILSTCILAPFSIDIFLSGIPEIGKMFPGHNIGLLVSLSLLGMCIGQPFSGPFLDRFGRKIIMLIGLIIFISATCFIIFSSSYQLLVICKFLQTLGGSFCVVGVFAIARDIYHNEELPHAIGLILALIGISPILAPLIGSYVNTFWNWRASFVVLLFMGIFYLFVIAFIYHETLSEDHKSTLHVKLFFKNMYRIIKTPNYINYTLAAACAYSIIFSFLNISSILLIQQLGISKINYGWLVGINAVAILLMARVAPIITKKYSVRISITFGLSAIISGAILMIILNYISSTVWLIMIPMFIITIGTGTLRPVTNAAAMLLIPKNLSGQSAGTFSLITFSIATLSNIFVVKIVHSAVLFGFWNLCFAFAAVGVIALRSNVANKKARTI